MSKSVSQWSLLRLAGGVAVAAVGTWSVYFDDAANGLTSGALDLDAISFAGTP